jgi:hypothetical protein
VCDLDEDAALMRREIAADGHEKFQVGGHLYVQNVGTTHGDD